ncbi:MAG: PAS domain S-box protein, partial [Actinobacteria bacterium]|nr:PAS domain S-box protein [Actinomycetota bacterium]
EERYRRLVETAPEVIYNLSAEDGTITLLNPAFERITGWSRAEWLGKSFTPLVHPDDLTLAMETFQQTSRGEATPPYELRILSKSGEYFSGEFTSFPHIEKRKVIGEFGIARDITERKRAEEALRESEERWRSLVSVLPDYVSLLDREGRILFLNHYAEGFTEKEVIGSSVCQYLSTQSKEIFEKEIAECQNTGKIRKFEHTAMGDHGIMREYEDYLVPILEKNKATSTLVISRDITERKRAEEEVRQKAKELQEKNEELTRFTYAVSHDLRSPLVTIQTFQGHLERDIRSQDAARVEKDLGYIRNAAGKMGRLLDELLRFSRVGRIMNPSEEAPLQAIVKEALDLAAGRITGRGVRIDLTEEAVVLYGDRTRLVEVFINLVDNAVKFMGDEPAPRVEIGVEQAGEELVLHVRDNGIGIDPRLQPMLFGLFHKLDPGSEGEGIGLALVKRIVELHGGRIWVESAGIGTGATFRFTLAKTRRKRGREETP